MLIQSLVAGERQTVGLLRDVERLRGDRAAVARIGVEQCRVLGEHVEHQRRIAARPRHRTEERRPVARLDGADLERGGIDVGDAAALRVRDPHERARRDGRLVVGLHLLLRRRSGWSRALARAGGPRFRRVGRERIVCGDRIRRTAGEQKQRGHGPRKWRSTSHPIPSFRERTRSNACAMSPKPPKIRRISTMRSVRSRRPTSRALACMSRQRRVDHAGSVSSRSTRRGGSRCRCLAAATLPCDRDRRPIRRGGGGS